ncbi:hypothetical protein [Trichoplusia ni ascovirus 6b]|nr:hypothetical protein [Trichoplusia ni ascovirus 6b]
MSEFDLKTDNCFYYNYYYHQYYYYYPVITYCDYCKDWVYVYSFIITMTPPTLQQPIDDQKYNTMTTPKNCSSLNKPIPMKINKKKRRSGRCKNLLTKRRLVFGEDEMEVLNSKTPPYQNPRAINKLNIKKSSSSSSIASSTSSSSSSVIRVLEFN